MNKRYVEVDSLRGLASLAVLLCHLLIIIPQIDSAKYYDNNVLIKILKFTPIHIFWGGHESVIFFFVLSGFVLSLPFYKSSEKFYYIPFLVKRICRIYIPYLLATAFALIMYSLFSKVNVNELSSWFNTVGSIQIDNELVLNNLNLIKSFKFDDINPVVWSLVHEMRISIIFPIIMILVMKLDWKTNIFIAIILSNCSRIINLMIIKYTNFQTDYFDTLHYISFFIIGALLAKHRDELIERFTVLNKKMKFLVIIFSVLAYTHSQWIYLIKPLRINLFHVPIINDWGISLGVIAFIIIALSMKNVSNVLQKKPIVFIGKISYSLYLYHFICLVSSVNILYGLIPLWLILFIAFISSFLFASVSYYAVEVHSINLGKYLSSKILRNKKLQVEQSI